MKQKTQKPAIALKTYNEMSYLLKQIHSGGTGDCNICKKVNTKGFVIYSIDLNCKVFLCSFNARGFVYG